MKITHKIFGLAFIAVFLVTGFYMRLRFPDIFQGDVGMRLMFRSAHVYIMLAALLNLLLGSYWQPCPARGRMQSIGSVFILASPVVFTLAFFVEPAPQKLDRPIALLGLALAFFGVLLHTIASGKKTTA
jgi:hypothetical protein